MMMIMIMIRQVLPAISRSFKHRLHILDRKPSSIYNLRLSDLDLDRLALEDNGLLPDLLQVC